MRITAMTTFLVAPRWLFLKVETDEGIVGWGEPTLEGQCHAVIGALKDLEPRIIGADPTKIERLWQVLYRGSFYRGGPVVVSAISGLEQACWDILGKSLGVPAHALLGGACRHSIRMYRGAHGDTPEEILEEALRIVDQGYGAIKTGPLGATAPVAGPETIKRCVRVMETLRSALPDHIDIALDFHGRVSPAMARVLLDALKDYWPFFVEEPVLPENTRALAELNRASLTPLATGERLFTKWGFRDVIESESVAIVQPDLCHCGGILEAKKIAAMAEARYIAIAPHNPLGPISTAACLQLDACAPNFLIQETVGFDDGYLREPFELRPDGTVAVSDKPGLGIEVDEDFVRANPFDQWINPQYDTPDGFIADW